MVPGAEPLVLCNGLDAGGEPLTSGSLLPLLGLAKLLAADAVHLACRGNLDVGSGVKLGERELSVQELLRGTPLLPDYAVIDGGPGETSAVMLRACGAAAIAGKIDLRPTPAGAAEFLLLEPFAFAARSKDWPSLVRTMLAPHLSGLDPLQADALTDAQRSRFLVGGDALQAAASAQPPLLRLSLAVRDLAAWWTWRTAGDLPPWTGPRMGTRTGDQANPATQRWSFTNRGPTASIEAFAYPGHKAGWLWIGPPPTARSVFDVIKRTKAFEADLSATGRFQGAAAIAPAPVQSPPKANSPLAGTRWRTPEGAAGQPECRITFGATLAAPLQLLFADAEATMPLLLKEGDCLTCRTLRDAALPRQLWMRPLPDAAAPTRLSVIVLATRLHVGQQVAAAPCCLELVRDGS